METKVNYTAVGIFVIALVISIVFAVIWLSAGLNTEGTNTFRVYMTESVNGLSTDAQVEYNGVNVGKVKSIQLNPHNPQVVDLLLDIDKSAPITVATRATLNTRGLTGVTYIALVDKGSDKTLLTKTEDQPYPVIQTTPSLYLRLDTALTKFNDSVHNISISVRNLLDDENLRAVKQTLQHLEQTSEVLAENSHEMTRILQNTALATERFIPLVQSSQHAVQVFSTQTLPIATEAVTNLSAIADNLSAVSLELKRNPSVLIRGKKPRPAGPGE